MSNSYVVSDHCPQLEVDVVSVSYLVKPTRLGGN